MKLNFYPFLGLQKLVKCELNTQAREYQKSYDKSNKFYHIIHLETKSTITDDNQNCIFLFQNMKNYREAEIVEMQE